MKVKELIAELQRMQPDEEVYYQTDPDTAFGLDKMPVDTVSLQRDENGNFVLLI